jgi:predicted alpha/beta hydrolase family esterase
LGELRLDVVIDKIKESAAPCADDLVLIGHSVGGLIVQKLIAERIGQLGIAICSVAPNRMLSLDWGFFKNSAAITNPLKGDAPFPIECSWLPRELRQRLVASRITSSLARLRR